MFSRLKQRFYDRLDVRLSAYYTFILLFLFITLAGFLLYRLHTNLIKQVDRILHDESLELFEAIGSEMGLRAACEEFEEGIATRKFYPLYFRILGAPGQVLYVSRSVVKKKPVGHLVFPEIIAGADDIYYSFHVAGRSPFRCYQHNTSTHSARSLTVQMVTPLSRPYGILENFLDNIMYITPLVAVIGILFGIVTAGKPFQVIRTINTALQRIHSKSLDARLPVPSTDSEVKQLTEAINDMLIRLEKSFENIRQFTADVAHELRTPIFAVRGELELLLTSDEKTHDHRDIAAGCLERIDGLEKMIKDLLTISRFESETAAPVLTVVDLSEVLQDLHAFFMPIAQDKGVAFSMSTAGAVCMPADKSMLQRLMSNLIDNALKFTPAGGTVHAALTRADGRIALSVTDSGIGIPPEEVEHIFKRFYQVDKARSGRERGAGLGLQICERIVALHGGRIQVTSHAGTGVTFTALFPATPLAA